jgi:hypothetical protein
MSTAGPPARRWRDARAELLIGAVAVVIAAAAGAALAGWPGLAVVAVGTAAVALLLLRALLPRSAAHSFRTARGKPRAAIIYGYGQRAFVIASSLHNRAVYETDLRPVLEHVLAARLAENHAINLYAEPDLAKRAFCETKADETAWRWVDPRQSLSAGQSTRKNTGISRRLLARLIIRLEQL